MKTLQPASTEYLLKKAEYHLDRSNFYHGYSKSQNGLLCLYCLSVEYNGEVGIVHSETCIIIELREALK